MARMLESRSITSAWTSCRIRRLALAVWLAFAIAPAVVGKEPSQPKGPPTYTKDVAPILQNKCQVCHRPHHVGPFPLETYEQARKRATDIVTVTSERRMPPWKAAPGVGPKLKHDRSLTAREIDLLEDWAEAGAPRGDPKDMPPPPVFPEGWKLGTPDLVLEPSEDYAIPASGPDTYHCFVIPTNLPKDTYITAIDFRPGCHRVVHHINAFIDTTGDARKRDEEEPGPGYTSFSGPGIPLYNDLSFWAAGHEPIPLPPGIGQRLPRQCDIILQIHYHPTGKPEVDRTQIALYFSRDKVKQALHWSSASNSDFDLRAGNSNVEVKATWFVPIDVDVLAVSPHMHQLGHDMRMVATMPSNRTIDLIFVPDWDPGWQSAYYFEKPVFLPRGTVVKVIAHYDNSAQPRNPNNPPKRVKWGYTADEEMCEGFIAVVKRGQDLTSPHSSDDLAVIFGKQNFRKFLKRMEKANAIH